MKKIVYIIVSFMFLLPCMVNAESYLNTKEIANKYILNTTYRGTYQRYLLTNTSNYYIGGETEGFDNGGLISYNEFLISQNRKSPMFSYLYDGYNYWTYTKSGDKRYIVSNINDVKVNESDTTPKARVTQYVKSETRVEGSGTISDPWIFVPSYEVNITTNDYGSISIRKNNSCTEGSLIKEVDLTYIKGDTLDICIRPNNGYVYVSNDCASYLTLSSTKDYLTLKNVTKDINCKIYFGKSSNKIILEQTGAEVTSLPTEIYLIYSQGWYKDKEATTQIVSLDRIPKRTGYSFDGYTHQNTDGTTLEIINSSGKVITNENTLNSFEREGSLKINWEAKTTSITLDNQGGSAESIDIVATYDSDMPTITTLPKRVGYTFDGYYYGTNGSGTKYYNADGTSANKWNIDSGNVTLYAYWIPNNLNIVFNANGANSIKNEVTLDGTKYYWKLNTNGNIMRSTNGTDYKENFYSRNYTLNIDLPNYNYSDYIKLTKTGYTALSGKEWCTNPDGSGKCFNQSVEYSAEDICPNIVSGDCNITLYTNWKIDKIVCTKTSDLANIIQCGVKDTSKTINYTGKCSYKCESADNFKIKFLTSGTLTLNGSLNIDAFLVGGGGGGSNVYYGCGGGGGYTKTIKDINVSGINVITVGDGGKVNGNGGKSTAFGYTAAGGYGGRTNKGGNGGSGGSCQCGIGGSYGNNGKSVWCDNGTVAPGSGKGQATTKGPNGETGNTCEFGEGTTSGCTKGTNYAYSGGGGSGITPYCSDNVGCKSYGGGSQCGITGRNGDPFNGLNGCIPAIENTGGGGGSSYDSEDPKPTKGASGIVIIRNKR